MDTLPAQGKSLHLPAIASTRADVPWLAISVEAQGGAVEGAAPRFPFLFEGAAYFSETK